MAKVPALAIIPDFTLTDVKTVAELLDLDCIIYIFSTRLNQKWSFKSLITEERGEITLKLDFDALPSRGSAREDPIGSDILQVFAEHVEKTDSGEYRRSAQVEPRVRAFSEIPLSRRGGRYVDHRS